MFLGLFGLLTLLEQRVGQQLNICALAYKKVNDQLVYLYGGGLLSETFPSSFLHRF